MLVSGVDVSAVDQRNKNNPANPVNPVKKTRHPQHLDTPRSGESKKNFQT
jgi:hypothetical protein